MKCLNIYICFGEELRRRNPNLGTKRPKPRLLLYFLLLSLISLIWLLGVQLFSDGEGVHHHANFQNYIHGQRQSFESFNYYEEVSICSEAYSYQPTSRVHMHDDVAHLIHVHDQAVTYGHFMANLGLNLSESHFRNTPITPYR